MTQFIIRVASRKSIMEDYLSQQITFSCPANWYDYAVKHHNLKIGDQLECVYAHIPLNDPRINEVDLFGNPMRNNLTMLVDDRNNSAYLRYEPVLLTPAFCFYQYNIECKIIRENNGFSFDLADYCNDMDYKLDDALFLVVHSAGEFEEDLKTNIPIAVNENQNILITDGTGGYVQSFDRNRSINFCLVDYDKHNFKDYFYEKNSYHKEMWWKSPDYRNQQEGRIVIPAVHFRQRYSDVAEYDWKKNLLKVHLPHLKNYASIVDGSKNRYLHFYLDTDNKVKISGDFIDPSNFNY